MRLFHVSEEDDINEFHPRTPTRKDIDHSIALVWAINERCLPNFLTPRNCPRVTYHISGSTNSQDIDRYISSQSLSHVVAIEQDWLKRMMETSLYLYEFNPQHFTLQDNVAGYYVSSDIQVPIAKHVINDLFAELFLHNVELRVLDNLLDFGEKIKQTSFNWSICRMAYAKPKS